MWTVALVEEVHEWFHALAPFEQDRIAGALDTLATEGPALGRPTVDTVSHTKVKNMKELRSGTVRILFVFDPDRAAVLLVAGDKSGDWQGWYTKNIPVAESRYKRWLEGEYKEEL